MIGAKAVFRDRRFVAELRQSPLRGLDHFPIAMQTVQQAAIGRSRHDAREVKARRHQRSDCASMSWHAVSNARAKAAPSISSDLCMRSRNVRRSCASLRDPCRDCRRPQRSALMNSLQDRRVQHASAVLSHCAKAPCVRRASRRECPSRGIGMWSYRRRRGTDRARHRSAQQREEVRRREKREHANLFAVGAAIDEFVDNHLSAAWDSVRRAQRSTGVRAYCSRRIAAHASRAAAETFAHWLTDPKVTVPIESTGGSVMAGAPPSGAKQP